MRRQEAGGSCLLLTRVCEQQGVEVFGAEIRRVFEQTIEGGVAGGDRDNGKAIRTRRGDVRWRVPDDNDGGMVAGSFAGCGRRRGNHVGALLMHIAEAAEGEVLAQSGALQLEPTDGFEVAGGDPEPL